MHIFQVSTNSYPLKMYELVQFLKVRAIIKSSKFSFSHKMKIVRDKGLITEQDPESDRLTGHPFHPWRARIADR